MSTTALPHFIDGELGENLLTLVTALNRITQYIDAGNGAPTHTPAAGPRIWIRLDGGAGTTLYCWSGAAWNAFA